MAILLRIEVRGYRGNGADLIARPPKVLVNGDTILGLTSAHPEMVDFGSWQDRSRWRPQALPG
jgi:hypothetical protein